MSPVIPERAIFWLSTFVFVSMLNSLKSRSAFKKLQKAPGDTSVEEITPLTKLMVRVFKPRKSFS
jgi:hypothetical protein